MKMFYETSKEEVVSKNDMWKTNEIVGIKDEYEDDLKYINVKTFIKYLAITYIARGKFIPKNSSDEHLPTVVEALSTMLNQENNTEIHKKVKYHSILRNEISSLSANIIHWMKKTDFSEFGKGNKFFNYFSKLEKISKSENVPVTDCNLVAAIFQSYLQYRAEKKKLETIGKDYVGKIGERIRFNGTVMSVKPVKRKNCIYVFHNMSGKIIKWISEKDVGFELGETYGVSGEVKSHEVDKWTKIPTTVIINGKRETI